AAAKRVASDADGSLLKQAIADHKNNAGLYDATKNAQFLDDELLGTGKSLLDISIPPLMEALKKAHVPMLIFVSWFDAGTVQGTLQRYRDFGNTQRIFIGEWSHGGGFDANPFKHGGSPADPGPEQQMAEALAFFNHYLKDVRDDASAQRGIHYFTAGTDQWQQTNVWPPPALGKVVYHLDGDGRLADKPGSKTIAVALKNTATGDQNRWRTQFGGHPVAYDDVLPGMQTLTSFTTAPIDKPLEITGQPVLHVRLACTGGDPSLFAYLTALDDQGKAVYLTEGQLRLADRKGTFLRSDAEPVPNGTPIDATVTFFPTSAVVPAGWRLRLLLASGDTSSFATSGPFDATIFSSSTIELPAITRQNAAPAKTGSTLTAAQWHDDLRFFARELAAKHANAFHHLTRAQFDEEVAALDRQIDTLDSDAIYIGLDRIAASIGDAHTFVRFPADSAQLPIVIADFDGIDRVVSIAADLNQGHHQPLGARVVSIEGMPISRVRELIETITPAEEPRLRESLVVQHMSVGLVLHGLGIAPSRTLVHYTLADDTGYEFVVTVHAGPSDDLARVVAYPPLFRQNPDKRFWFTWLPGSRAVYCNFRGYQDLETNAQALLAFVAEKHPEKLIIDMRQNGGGDYFEGLRYLVEPIRKLPEINRKGHLFVLIGVQTFSAAMANAAHFRQMTEATLVGRTIGENPNSYQEPREQTMPNSRLVFRYSTKLYEFNKGGENAIRPDHEVIVTWDEYKAGRDPVLEWVVGR
ncbi:MAG TPA: CocE/NonD family hydrolase, partial [Thermoanaerobaculia bacterium]|nr:CocE/NonD family hydrolase [Thermoanaerobaculia bacterium]